MEGFEPNKWNDIINFPKLAVLVKFYLIFKAENSILGFQKK